LHVPPTVQGVLASRIDRLAPDEKALLQQLAVIGREFPLSLIRQVLLQPEDELYRLLYSLQHKEFLYEQPALLEVEYRFKHALTQEVAYSSLLQEQRRPLHEHTAQAIEILYRGNLEDHYSDLAYHYTRSGNTEKAGEFLHLAGRQAIQRSAHVEAITHLTTALELLSTLPATRERTQQELSLQITLGIPLAATKGWASPEVERVYTRARELCERVGETPQLFPILQGLRLSYLLRGKLEMARELGEQLLCLAQTGQDPALRVEAHLALGAALFNLGELVAARAQAEQGIALYDPQQYQSHTFLYDPGAVCLSWAAWALWFLGYPNQALKRSQEALTVVRDLSHPYSLAVTLNFAVWLHQCRREGQATQEQAEALITLSTAQGFSLLLAHGTISRGWALAEQGQAKEGISQLCQGLAAYGDMGLATPSSIHLARLAEAYGKAGKIEEGLTALAEALAVIDKTGERFYEAELYRLKGELLLAQEIKNQKSKIKSQKSENPKPNSRILDPFSEAEACFRQAIDIAHRQQAKSLELRAVMSLVRLRQYQVQDHEPRNTQHDSHARLAEAHRMLSKVYNWFTEGFDTKDLQEAKALLESLSS